MKRNPADSTRPCPAGAEESGGQLRRSRPPWVSHERGREHADRAAGGWSEAGGGGFSRTAIHLRRRGSGLSDHSRLEGRERKDDRARFRSGWRWGQVGRREWSVRSAPAPNGKSRLWPSARLSARWSPKRRMLRATRSSLGGFYAEGLILNGGHGGFDAAIHAATGTTGWDGFGPTD